MKAKTNNLYWLDKRLSSYFKVFEIKIRSLFHTNERTLAKIDEVDDIFMIITNNPTQTKTLQTRFLVYVRDFLKSIEVHEIAYFFFEEKITYVVTHKNEKYMLHRTLNQLEEKLDERDFFRVNRVYLVSYQSISKIEPYLGNRLIVFFKPDSQVKAVVSREKVSEFKAWLNY